MNLQHNVDGFYFRNDVFAIAAPAKCGSSSVRQYLMSWYPATAPFHNMLTLENKLTSLTDTWNDGSAPAVVVIRDPIDRWTSGVIEAVRYIESGNSLGGIQTFQQHWDDHINPMFHHLNKENSEYRYILLENLPDYLQNPVRLNRTDMERTLFQQIRRVRNPLIRILYERDREWLEEEKRFYDKLISTPGKEVGVPEFRSWIEKCI